MGQGARQLVTPARGNDRAQRPRLRVVASSRKPAPSAAAEAACKSLFQLGVVVCVALATLAMARVALSAKVAEASVDQTQLERSIKAETRVADRLELDRSLLVTPSRIESIAAGLQMTKAPAVRYIALPGTATQSDARAVRAGGIEARSAGRPAQALAGMLGAAVEVTKKEARTLLVGDVGVAASR